MTTPFWLWIGDRLAFFGIGVLIGIDFGVNAVFVAIPALIWATAAAWKRLPR